MKLKSVFTIAAMLVVVFLTGCRKDDEPGLRPKVTSTDPITNATNIPINSKISATFSVAMDSSSINATNFQLLNGTTIVAGTIKYSGTTASFIPTTNLTPNTSYTGTISTGVKNVSGTSLVTNYRWSFTTGSTSDITIPTIALSSPENNATGVALNHQISATFSKPMDQSSINSYTFTLKQGLISISGTVTYTGNVATFTPAGNLMSNKIYTATISTGVMDMAGHTIAGNYVFSFTTGDAPDAALPMVNSTDPLNNNLEVGRNKVVSITFSEPMDPTTINPSTFTLKHETTLIQGTVYYSGNKAIFTPTSTLDAATNYTAMITNSAKDLAGNALSSNIQWSFTTGGSLSGLAIVELGAASNYVILAKTAINNISTSAITGNLGLSPSATSYVTGFALTNATGYATSSQITGRIYAADMADPTPINLTTAVNNMLTAYTDAAGRPSPDYTDLGTGNIGGKTLTSGLYKWTSTVTIPSDITISGGANDVWIFQIAGNLNMSSAVKITLNGGAQAKNIFWQVAGEVTLGTTSHFEGIILSMTGITFQTGASINGRAFAQTAVILDSNTVTKP